jgi:hypothetical protein
MRLSRSPFAAKKKQTPCDRKWSKKSDIEIITKLLFSALFGVEIY